MGYYEDRYGCGIEYIDFLLEYYLYIIIGIGIIVLISLLVLIIKKKKKRTILE